MVCTTHSSANINIFFKRADCLWLGSLRWFLGPDKSCNKAIPDSQGESPASPRILKKTGNSLELQYQAATH